MKPVFEESYRVFGTGPSPEVIFGGGRRLFERTDRAVGEKGDGFKLPVPACYEGELLVSFRRQAGDAAQPACLGEPFGTQRLRLPHLDVVGDGADPARPAVGGQKVARALVACPEAYDKELKLTEFLLTSVTVTNYGAVPPLSERIVDW